jgi:hypothetical protein
MLQITGESRMRKELHVLALTFGGFALVLPQLAPAYTASAAQQPPIVVAQASSTQPQPRNLSARSIDDLFRDFTAEWVRSDAGLATRSRYFTGAEQDRLERQSARAENVANARALLGGAVQPTSAQDTASANTASAEPATPTP